MHIHTLRPGFEVTQVLCDECQKGWRMDDARRESLATIDALQTALAEITHAARRYKTAVSNPSYNRWPSDQHEDRAFREERQAWGDILAILAKHEST